MPKVEGVERPAGLLQVAADIPDGGMITVTRDGDLVVVEIRLPNAPLVTMKSPVERCGDPFVNQVFLHQLSLQVARLMGGKC